MSRSLSELGRSRYSRKRLLMSSTVIAEVISGLRTALVAIDPSKSTGALFAGPYVTLSLVPSRRNALQRYMADPILFRVRRRRAMRRYIKELGFEIYDRTIRLEREELEERIIARRHGFYDRLVKDVMERT